jgi:hypothetical protein
MMLDAKKCSNLAERGEFELPVPISEQPDDNMRVGVRGAQTKCRDRPRLKHIVGFYCRQHSKETLPPAGRTTSRLMSPQRSNKRAGHFAPVAPSDPKAKGAAARLSAAFRHPNIDDLARGIRALKNFTKSGVGCTPEPIQDDGAVILRDGPRIWAAGMPLRPSRAAQLMVSPFLTQ